MVNFNWVWALIYAGLFLISACSSANQPINESISKISQDDGNTDGIAEANAQMSSQSQLAAAAPTQTPIQLSTATPKPLILPTSETASNLEADQSSLSCSQPELFRAGRLCFFSADGEMFVHPISMVSNGQLAWLLDGGRILQIDLVNPSPPIILLAPGDLIADRPVQEPLDLSLIDLGNDEGMGLLVLDRVGDVYLLNFATGEWQQDWYSRPIGETSSHYYLSLSTNGADRYLLEASYRYGIRYLPGQEETGWSVDEESVLVDFAVLRGSAASFAYVLQRPIDAPQAKIIRYVQGQIDGNFRPNIEIIQPREIQVGPRAVYLLDKGGSRLSVLNNENGTLLSQTEFPFPISTFALYLDEFGSSLTVYAGRNTIYLPGQPDNQIDIDVTGQPSILRGNLAYDLQTWDQLPELILPIDNLPPDSQELRLPGAPRHYRQGIHEGMDFYWSPGGEIRAVAAGTVVRAGWDYVEPWPELFAYYRSESAELGETSELGLDFFRGRQIWLQHENGFISRHAHLQSIDPAIEVGAQVAQGQIIGQVGNSGSPGSLDGPGVDSHLHFELWYGNRGYLGQYLRPIETRELIESIFSTK